MRMTVRSTVGLLALGLMLAVATNLQAADDAAPSPVGKQIAAFELDDYLGQPYSFSQWKDKKAVVVVFLGVECPLAKLYGRRLAELDERFRDRGVQFVGINSNQQDTPTNIGHFAEKHKIDFPMLKDPANKVADGFGAERTPEAFLLDANGKVRYWGAIDDQYGVGYARPEATAEWLVDAIDNLLADEPIKTASTEPVGCYIGRVSRVEPTGDINYTKHIAGILNEHCVSCHRPNQIAPFTLTSYDEVVGWGETICEVVADQRMPPWHANPDHGEFLNDARMPDEHKRLIREWVKNGMPEGDKADLPPAPKFDTEWQIGKPDLIVRMPKAYKVSAKGVLPYQYFVIDPGFTEDMWVQGAEARPGNPSVVHHMIMFYIPPETKRPDGADALRHAIATFAPGMPATFGPEAYCRRIPAGSKLVFQMHYTPNGSEQIDLSEAGIVFADPKKVQKEIKLGSAVNWRFAIPPNASNFPVEARHRFDDEVLLYTLTPHMHVRGKSFRFTAIYPDRTKEILLDVPQYDFNWQNVYLLKEPKHLPPGTELFCEAKFDNSESNKANPDPNQTVRWGDQTWEEMTIGSYAVSLVDQDLTIGPPQQRRLDDGDYEVTFRYKPSGEVKSVHVAGDFNDWSRDTLKLAGPDADGFYTIKHKLPAGRYEYKFLVDGDDWKPDPGVAERTRAFRNSVLTVGNGT